MKSLFNRLRMPPDCREVAKVLQSFLDGELPPEQAGLVADHVEHCDRCGIDADVYRQVKDSLAQLRSPADRDVVGRLVAFADDLVGDGE